MVQILTNAFLTVVLINLDLNAKTNFTLKTTNVLLYAETTKFLMEKIVMTAIEMMAKAVIQIVMGQYLDLIVHPQRLTQLRPLRMGHYIVRTFAETELLF